jgi:hypothetical protein
MENSMQHDGPEVFISYASRDHDRVLAIAEHLQTAGVSLWLDRQKITGGTSYGPEIVHGIKACKVLMLMCSDAALRSRNVKQEIQLGWKYSRPYLPLLLDMVSFPEQVEYWLEGWQWVEVLDRSPDHWLPNVLGALKLAGVRCASDGDGAAEGQSAVRPTSPLAGLAGLRAAARFTDQIWPVHADNPRREPQRGRCRDLGAPQDEVQHGHRIGSRVRLALESDREAHLLLLDEGPTGNVYCLCPSWFAPDTRLRAGRSYLPQNGSRFDSFAISGQPGREHLLAILTEEPLGLDWMSSDPKTPARVLTPEDVATLLDRLERLECDRWTALATYFDVLPGS